MSRLWNEVKRAWRWVEPWLSLGVLILLLRALLIKAHGWDWIERFFWFCLFVNYFRNKAEGWLRGMLL